MSAYHPTTRRLFVHNVARRLGVPVRTVRHWAKTGRIRATKDGPNDLDHHRRRSRRIQAQLRSQSGSRVMAALLRLTIEKYPNGRKAFRMWIHQYAGVVIIAVCGIIALALLAYSGGISPEVFGDAL